MCLFFQWFPAWEPQKKVSGLPIPPKLLGTVCVFVTLLEISRFLRKSKWISFINGTKWFFLLKCSCPVSTRNHCVWAGWYLFTLMNLLYFSSRFRMLAKHFQKMYQNLNINIDSDLEQLKVRETTANIYSCCFKAFVSADNSFAFLLTDSCTFFEDL